MKKAIRPIRATRINASKISAMMIPIGLSPPTPPQHSPQLVRLSPPAQQTVVGGRQSQLPLAGPGVGT